MALLTSIPGHFRVGARLLVRNLGFTSIAVVALALGIGPTTAIFSVVYANLLAPLPYPQSDQLVMIWSKIKGNRNQVSAADFQDWRRQATLYQGLAALIDQEYNLSSTQEPQYIQGERASTNFHLLLGETVAMGRNFRSDEDQPGKDHVVILSHRCWVNRFAADASIIGKQVQLNGEPYTVIGVLPPGLSDRRDEELSVPLRFSRQELARIATFWSVLGRLKPGATLKQAQQEMDAIARRISELYPESNKGVGASVEPLRNNSLSQDTRNSLWLLLSTVGFVLLIACVNVANLQLSRGVGRQRELAIRAAMGSSKIELLLQLLAENLMLALIGGVIGTVFSVVILKAILAIVPPGTLSPEADVRLNLPVVLFTLAITIAAGILFGCAPALQARDLDLNEALKQGGTLAVGNRHRRVRGILVVIEFALALTLLAGAALTIHSFLNRMHIDLGVRTDHILTFYLPVPQSRLVKAQQSENFYSELLTTIEAIPGVQRASATTDTPLDDTNFDMSFEVKGHPVSEPSLLLEASFQAVTPGYFQTFGVHLENGRVFDGWDRAESPRVAIVNETFVRRFLKGGDVLSQRLIVNQTLNGILSLGATVEWQIVGVLHDIQNSGRFGEPKRPQIYVPFAQSPWPQATIAVRTAIDAEKMRQSLAAAVHSLDPNLPLVNVKTMNQLVHDHFGDDRFGMALYGALSGIGLLWAAIGIYGVMSFTVAQRASEIGLRAALGASSRQLVAEVLREGLILAAFGVMFGLAGAYYVSRAMASTLFGTGSIDWQAMSAAAALLLVTALLACYLPARRASSVDPIAALRHG